MKTRIHRGEFFTYTWSHNVWMRLAFQTRRVRALRVGLYLWYKAARVKSRRVTISSSEVQREFGGERSDVIRGLRDLAARRLIEVQWRPRHASLVTLPSDREIREMLNTISTRAEAWLEEQETAFERSAID